MTRNALRRIAVTGSECTGKTTLAQALARHYQTEWVPELVRDFVRQKGAPPEVNDLDEIARRQIARQEQHAGQVDRLLILDTDLLSTVVYGHHYYDACPQWIEEASSRDAADLYLLADIDVPWVADDGQRDRGDRREEMQSLFRDALTSRGLPVVEISGALSARVRQAALRIDELLRKAFPDASTHSRRASSPD